MQFTCKTCIDSIHDTVLELANPIKVDRRFSCYMICANFQKTVAQIAVLCLTDMDLCASDLHYCGRHSDCVYTGDHGAKYKHITVC